MWQAIRGRFGADEKGTLAALKAIRRELGDPKVKEHHPLLEFSIVVDAVRCAVEVQRQMAERNADVPPERRIEFSSVLAWAEKGGSITPPVFPLTGRRIQAAGT